MVSQACGLELQMIFCNKNKSFLIKELIFCMFWNFCCCEVNWHFNLPALCRPGLDLRVAAAAVSPMPASPHMECAYISSASCTHRQSTPLTFLTRTCSPFPPVLPCDDGGEQGWPDRDVVHLGDPNMQKIHMLYTNMICAKIHFTQQKRVICNINVQKLKIYHLSTKSC